MTAPGGVRLCRRCPHLRRGDYCSNHLDRQPPGTELPDRCRRVGESGLEGFCKQTNALFRHVKAVPTDLGTDEILIPGELEYRAREQRECDGGIPVTDALWADITEWAKRLGVDV